MAVVFSNTESSPSGFTRADDEVSRLRIPPHSIEAEQSVIGGLLLDNSAWTALAICSAMAISTASSTN